MNVRELRIQTGLSQSKFALKFGIPVSTLKDWEHERRNPPEYVINMMQTILQNEGFIINEHYVELCNRRKRGVERALAIIYSATNGPNDMFLEALELYIDGKMSLVEMERRIDNFEYLEY